MTWASVAGVGGVFCFLLAGLAVVQAAGPTYVKGTLNADTVWRPSGNPYYVQADLTVPRGITLTILPGCDIRLRPTGSSDNTDSGTSGTDMIILGSLRAQGTPEAPISFSSATGDARWGSLYFASLDQCLLSYAYVLNGKIICNGSSPEISRCCISGGGGVEIGYSAAPKLINNIIDKNSTGIILWFPTSGGEIKGCKIIRNRYGIYAKEFSTVTITGNDIEDNTEYNVCNLSPHHALDVTGNWWGTTFPLSVEQRIYDGRKKDGLGWVVFSPMLDQEVDVALLAAPPSLSSNVPVLPPPTVEKEKITTIPGPPEAEIPQVLPTPVAPDMGGTGAVNAPTPVPPPTATPTSVPEEDKPKEEKKKSEEDEGPWKSRW